MRRRTMKMGRTALRAAGLGAILIVAGGAALRAADWPHFGYDDQMTSYAKLETKITAQNVKALKRVWGIGCDDAYFSVVFRCPALFKGKLLTTSAGQNLAAYKALDGAFLWDFGDAGSGWAPQPVLTTDGTVILLQGTIPTSLFAVASGTGKKLWEAPVTFDLGYSGAAYAIPAVDETRNVVYVVENKFGGDGKLYALNRKTGKVLWYKGKTVGGAAYRGTTVLLKGSWIFATAVVTVNYFEADKLARINAATRKVELFYDRPAPEQSYDIGWATLCNDWLVVVYHDRDDVFRGKSVLCVYDVDSAEVVWQKAFETSAVTGAVAANTDKNVIYVPTDPHLYAFDVKTGAQVWKYQGYDAILSPSVANGVVYFLSESNLYAVRETNKQRLFRYPLGHEAEPSTQVAIADGMLFFSGNGGTCDLFALGLKAAPDSIRRPDR
jgi:outer membrane protein assembly factor BamB